MTQNIGIGFRDADGALFDALVRCLDFMSNLPFFRAYKSHSWESLKIENGQIILDVACGTGSDLIALAGLHPRTRFIGVDRSKGFIELAKMRAEGSPNLEFLQGDGQRLPLSDRVVDAARIDRSLQHMESPGAVLAEMVRVTKDEGRIVACEPDWETFILYNGALADSGMIADHFRRSIRNPTIGRELATLMRHCGIRDLRTNLHALVTDSLTDADVIFDLRKVKDQSVAADVITKEAAEDWWRLSERSSQNKTFFAGLNIVETAGVVRIRP